MPKIDDISIQEYKRAFEAISDEITNNQLAMLRVHYQAPDHTVTATNLARAINFPNYSSINLQYGKFAGKLCVYLKVHPDIKVEVLVEFSPKEPGQDIMWPLRENVVKALKQLKWFEPIETGILEEIKRLKKSYDSESKTTQEIIVNSRLGQGFFREMLIQYWQCCAVTGCKDLMVLRASHIKPWKDSSNQERLDVFNGLLLVPNLDVAFDLGFITFQEYGKISISKEMSSTCCEQLGINTQMKISTLEQGHLPYLKYHREFVFRG
jgi:hypothetical protein